MMLLNSAPDAVLGRGFRAEDSAVIFCPEWQAAHDMWWRTEYMRDILARAGVRSGFVDYLQERTEDCLRAAKEALNRQDYTAYVQQARLAWSLTSRCYPAVLRVASSNVHGLVFYLFLIIPAAVLLERLLFGLTRVFARTAAIVLLGVALYYAVSVLHPGIRILRNPLVLFISFGLLALTGYVIALIWARFENTMARLKMKASGVTRESLSRGAAFGLALSVGIGNMRRSPARTALTLLSLTLFTVVVVTLVSVRATLFVNAVRQRHRPHLHGLLVRDPSHQGLPEAVARSLAKVAGPGCSVHPILMSDRVLTWTPHWKTTAILSGLPPSVLEQILTAGRVPAPDEWACLLPDLADPSAGLSTRAWIGSRRTLGGGSVEIAGVFDPERLERIVGLDGEPVTAIDLAALKEIRKIHEAMGQPDREVQAPRVPAARTVILSPPLMQRMGGVCDAVVVTSDDPERLKRLARDLILRTDFYGYYADPKEAVVFSASARKQVRGLSDIVIPVVICGLIILNTMLGAVAAQMRHIPTFSAVGLAPKHIANLFLVEGLAYSTLAVLVGFIMGQISARCLAVSGWVSGMVLDYSSSASLLGCGIVIGVTLLSTAFPAYRAMTVATPKAEKEDRPVFDGNTMSAVLPFALTGRQAAGGVGFLMAFLQDHDEMTGAESFFVANLTVARTGGVTGDDFEMRFDVWLPPIDLGNSQRVRIWARRDQHDVLTLHVAACRLTGDEQSWRTANVRFLSELRKRMLLWRMVEDSDRQRYARLLDEACRQSERITQTKP